MDCIIKKSNFVFVQKPNIFVVKKKAIKDFENVISEGAGECKEHNWVNL